MMAHLLRCPYCSKSMQLPDNVVGKTVRCPFCAKNVAVPAPEALAVAAVTPTASTTPAARILAGAETGNGARQATAPSKKCPACGSMLLEGAIACMDCGYL